MKSPSRKYITREISWWFFFLAVIPMSTGAIIVHINTRDIIIHELTGHLRDICRDRMKRIEDYVTERKQDIMVTAALPGVESALRECSGNFAINGIESARLETLAGEAGVYLQNQLRFYSYYDIFLINYQGDIVFSLAREDDLGTNLRTGPYKDSGLAKVFDMAITLLDSEISQLQYYEPSKKIAAFIATPVYSNNVVSGVLAIQLNEDRLFSIVNDYLGLGKSGELTAAYLRADKAIITAAPLRHRPGAFAHSFDLSRHPAIPIRLAVSGQQGAGLSIDYRGVDVLAAWGYVPSLNWGLVVKVDRSEAFGPVYRLDAITGGILVVALLLVAVGIYFATLSIANPIKKLALAMQRFSEGDFKQRAEVMVPNEVGLLAGVFNKMATEIDQYASSMEVLVARQTGELKRTMGNLDKAQAIAHVGSWEWNLSQRSISGSDEFFRIIGLDYPGNIMPYDDLLGVVHPDDRQMFAGSVSMVLEGVTGESWEHRVVRSRGEIRYVRQQAEILRSGDEQGQPTLLVAMQDETDLRQARRALQQYLTIVDQNVITSSTDLQGDITRVSDAFCRTTGYSREELIGKNHRLIRHPDTEEEVYRFLWQTIGKAEVWHGELKNRRKNGQDYWVDITISPKLDGNGVLVGYTSIQTDITDKKRIEEVSITDELTSLYNRRYFNEIFPRELQRARRNNMIFAFLMLDIDHFKKYNDTYGHQMGDEVLRKVGVVLKKNLKRSEDYAFRLGGEEFGIIMTIKHGEDARSLGGILVNDIELLHIPHQENSASPYVTISCGLTAMEMNKYVDMSLEEIYRRADSALYKAKESGRNKIVSYESRKN